MKLKTFEHSMPKEITWEPEVYDELECGHCNSNMFHVYLDSDREIHFMCCKCQKIYLTGIKVK